MGREVGLLLIVVILVIGEVWQEREPGTKVVLSRAGACMRACLCASPQLPAPRQSFQCHELSGLRVWGTGPEGLLWIIPSPCAHLSARPQETLARWLMAVQATAASVAVQLCLSGPRSQGPLCCPCLCDSLTPGRDLAPLTCTHGWCKALL